MIEAALPLITAAAQPGAVLVLGEKRICGWYESRPAVIDADPDSDTPGAALWVGSRHLTVFALRQGFFRPIHHGRELSVFALSEEGRHLARDMGQTLAQLRRRVRLLEADLAETMETIDTAADILAGIEDAESRSRRGRVGLQVVLLSRLTAARGAWVPGTILRALIEADVDQPPSERAVKTAVQELRKRGWIIESQRAPTAYRLVGKN